MTSKAVITASMLAASIAQNLSGLNKVHKKYIVVNDTTEGENKTGLNLNLRVLESDQNGEFTSELHIK